MDIYEILKGVPVGTKLYTPMCGKVAFTYLASSKETIGTKDKYGPRYFDKNGRWMEGGEVMLFPSDKMRDWSKFAWKKGDVLMVSVDNICIFDKWNNDEYTEFDAAFVTPDYRSDVLKTKYWHKVINEKAIERYISKIEKINGGKLNLTTLEIEKPKKKPKKKPVFELGRLYVFNEQDEDGELTIIGKLIGKNEDTLTFGNQYEIENEKFVTDQAFDLRISVHEELREATEDEAITFHSACSLWKKNQEKKSKEQPCFKPFDKVLVRSGRGFNWYPALFVRDRGENSARRYTALPIHIGTAADFTQCIPYEGHENFAFTDYDFVDLPF